MLVGPVNAPNAAAAVSPPAISLEIIELEQPWIVDIWQPFRATCTYRAAGVPPEPYCVRLDRLVSPFVRICTLADGRRLEGRMPVSNTAAALLDLPPIGPGGQPA